MGGHTCSQSKLHMMVDEEDEVLEEGDGTVHDGIEKEIIVEGGEMSVHAMTSNSSHSTL